MKTNAERRAIDDDEEATARRRVAEEIADRLRRRGVLLNGSESPAALADLLEAVERFESAVEARGGDLMMDEPIAGEPVTDPDDAAFVLPQREGAESMAAFTARVLELARRLRRPNDR